MPMFPELMEKRSVRNIIREIRATPGISVRDKKRAVIEWFDFHTLSGTLEDVVLQDRRGRFTGSPKDPEAVRRWKRDVFEELVGIRDLQRTIG